MKTALSSLITVALVAAAVVASGRQFDAADFSAIFLPAGLVAWTIEQYAREPRLALRSRALRLPIAAPGKSFTNRGARVARAA